MNSDLKPMMLLQSSSGSNAKQNGSPVTFRYYSELIYKYILPVLFLINWAIHFILAIMKRPSLRLRHHNGSMNWKKSRKSMSSAKFHPLRTFYPVRAIVWSWQIWVKRFSNRKTISFRALGTVTHIRMVLETRFPTHCCLSTKPRIP